MPRSRAQVVRLFALVAFAALATGCGAHGGLDNGVYRAKGVAFRVGGIPAGWRPLEVTHASLAWRDEAREGSALLNARCSERDEATPLRALGEHLVLGTTERSWTSVETIPFDGREALHGRVTAKLDGVPMAYDLFVLRKDGCIYDFVYVAPPTRLDEGVADFERFVEGFHSLRSGGGA